MGVVVLAAVIFEAGRTGLLSYPSGVEASVRGRHGKSSTGEGQGDGEEAGELHFDEFLVCLSCVRVSGILRGGWAEERCQDADSPPFIF